MYLIYIKQKITLCPKNTIGAVKSFGSKFRPSAPSVCSDGCLVNSVKIDGDDEATDFEKMMKSKMYLFVKTIKQSKAFGI